VAVLDGKLVDTYNGERTAAAIAKWGMSTALKQVSQLLGGGSAGGSSGAGSGGKSGGAAAEPGGGKYVVKLTGGNFDDKVIHTKAPVMVEFYAPVRHSTRVIHPSLCHSLMPRFPPSPCIVVWPLQAAGSQLGQGGGGAGAPGPHSGRSGLHCE
jgi:hypothetical protein